MPIVQIATSLTKAAFPRGFAKLFSSFLAEILEKDLAKITVAINCDALVCNGGDDSPFLLMNIHTIDRFLAGRNPEYTQKISEFVSKETKLPGNRIQIVYTDLSPDMLGKGT